MPHHLNPQEGGEGGGGKKTKPAAAATVTTHIKALQEAKEKGDYGTAAKLKPAAPGLQLKNLERLSPHLRGISIKTSVILTYNESITRKVMDTADETAGAPPLRMSIA